MSPHQQGLPLFIDLLKQYPKNICSSRYSWGTAKNIYPILFFIYYLTLHNFKKDFTYLLSAPPTIKP